MLCYAECRLCYRNRVHHADCPFESYMLSVVMKPIINAYQGLYCHDLKAFFTVN
jgi:hypothetical protein